MLLLLFFCRIFVFVYSFVAAAHALLRNVGSLVRDLSLRGDSGQVSALTVFPVDNGAVLGNTVVPNDNCALLPLDTSLEVGAQGNVVVEELKDGIGLFLLETNDLTGELGVDVESLLAGGRVSAHDGVSVDDGLTALDAVSGGSGIDLLNTRVGGLESVQALLEERAQAVVSSNGIDKNGVTTSLGLVEDVEEGSARRLSLV